MRSRMNVLVFKTTVQSNKDVSKLQPYINDIVKDGRWNFDLEDCDKIFRVETDENLNNSLIFLFNANGYSCEELED